MNLLRSEGSISLNYDVIPEDACGGVWVASEQRYVPVVPGPEYRDQEFGHSLWEYSDPTGNVRACLMRLESLGSSPVWALDQNAGEGQYRETQLTVSGDGLFERWREHFNGRLVRKVFEMPQSPSECPARVLPGDSFTFAAGTNGLVMLSVFPEKPFRLEYEKRTQRPVPNP